MSEKRRSFWYFVLLSLLPIFLDIRANAQTQKNVVEPQPNPPVAKKELLEHTGDFANASLSKDINILWLSGPEDHRPGEHDYIRIKELFVPLLASISRVSVEEAFQFPTKEQFVKADLLIQYLHLPDLTADQFQMYRDFVIRGGGVVSIHESCIMRPIAQAEKLAECIGCSWMGNQVSKWSKFDHSHPLFLQTEHPAFAGLPSTVLLNDESYWSLMTRGNVKSIGAIAPVADLEDRPFSQVMNTEGVRSHAFWTFQSGKGKVFGTTTGHYTYTFHDPMYRLLLMRGVAWVLGEDPAPFMPLVFEGITNKDGFVGTNDLMFNYKNRSR